MSVLNRFFSKGGLKSDDVIRIETPTYTTAKGSAEHADAYIDVNVANASDYIWSADMWNVNSGFNAYIRHIYTDTVKVRVFYYYKEISTMAAEYKFQLIGIKKN